MPVDGAAEGDVRRAAELLAVVVSHSLTNERARGHVLALMSALEVRQRAQSFERRRDLLLDPDTIRALCRHAHDADPEGTADDLAHALREIERDAPGLLEAIRRGEG